MNEYSFIHIYLVHLIMIDKESKKKEITEKRREQILKAALEIFSRKGYDGATIPEIARAAGIATGTIYIYYPSKRGLFVAVIKNFIITTRLLGLIDKMPKGNIVAILKAILKDRLDLVRNPAFARLPLLMSEVQRDPELKSLWLKEFLHPLLDGIAMIVRMMGTTGKFRQIQPEVLVRVIGGMFMGFLLLRAVEGDTSPLRKLKQDKVADDVAGFILHGLLKKGEGDKK
jgi:AcrR family transcriptional regulator